MRDELGYIPPTYCEGIEALGAWGAKPEPQWLILGETGYTLDLAKQAQRAKADLMVYS